MKKIMILGAGILQLPAIYEAKKMGLSVVVVDMNPEALGFKIDGIEKELISTIDTERVLEAAKKHRIDGIMTLASDMPMRTVARVSKEMGLTGISEETAFNATNKAAMRKCLKNAGVPVPEFYEVNSYDEYLDAVNSIKSEKIVKPVDNSGSRGVTLLRNDYTPSQARTAFYYAKESSRSGSVMVEEYMKGSEVSVETLSFNGECNVIQITDKLTTGSPHFVEMGHNQPSMLSESTKSRIREVAQMAVKAIGIENGPSHTEIMVTDEDAKIVELGARLGGDFITTNLVPLSTGVNMVKCCIDIALGNIPDMKILYNKGSAVRFFKSDVGTISAVDGLETASATDGVTELKMLRQIGERAEEICNSVDRIGYVIAQSDTPQNAVSICETAMSKVKIIIK